MIVKWMLKIVWLKMVFAQRFDWASRMKPIRAISLIYLNMMFYGSRKWLLYIKLWKMLRINSKSFKIRTTSKSILQIRNLNLQTLWKTIRKKVINFFKLLMSFWIQWIWRSVWKIWWSSIWKENIWKISWARKMISCKLSNKLNLEW